MNTQRALNTALELANAGRMDESESLLRGLPADNKVVQFDLGWHDMRHGKLNAGFEGLNQGRWIGVFGSPPIAGPIWKDQPLEGKTLLLRGEGGMGDEIINFRFARCFREKGANVIVSARSSLLSLFARHGFPGITDKAIPFVHYDYWVPAMSAAYVLGMEYAGLPGRAYLKADKALPPSETFRIGLRWGGNTEQKDLEPTRKIPVNALLDICKGRDIYSFQRDADRIDFPGTDLADKLTDWEATARYVASMDLMITSCTSAAHLSAALGVETWVLVPILPYYTWVMPGNTSPWYDSARLFRQTEPGNWDHPLNEIRTALQARIP